MRTTAWALAATILAGWSGVAQAQAIDSMARAVLVMKGDCSLRRSAEIRTV